MASVNEPCISSRAVIIRFLILWPFKLLSPEIERRINDSYDVTADIYSFGITLYVLLNELKFPGSGGYYARPEVQYNPDFIFPAPLHASEQMTGIIRKMCSFRAKDRYQSMPEVLMDLALAADKDGFEEAPEYLELADMATETYREQKPEVLPDEADTQKPMTRAERIKEQKIRDSIYRSYYVRAFIVLSLLFMLLIQGFQQDITIIGSWIFWAALIITILEAVLQQMQEIHIFSAALILIFSIYSIQNLGLTIPHMIVLICLLGGIPVLSAAGACAIGIWVLLELQQKILLSDLISKNDLGWVVLVIFFIVSDKLFEKVVEQKKTLCVRAAVSQGIFFLLALLMILSGIILLVLQNRQVYTIPDILNKMHLIRSGILSVLVISLTMKQEADECIEDGTEKVGNTASAVNEGEEEISHDIHLDK